MLGSIDQPKLLKMMFEKQRSKDLNGAEREAMIISLARTMKASESKPQHQQRLMLDTSRSNISSKISLTGGPLNS